jgi:class 3 adenylate cyclase/tetratricopeptide (TPR) repeat protein
MVFTDLVNSTALKAHLPGGSATARNQQYLEAILTPHRRRMEADLAAHGGRVVKTVGDAYFLVFADPVRAVEWAVGVQASHTADPIDTPLGPLQVKIGMHTGAPLPDPQDPCDYVGQEVDYAARVAALATGGQVVLSEVTAALVRGGGVVGCVLHTHGERELKGIGLVPVFELLYGGRPPQPLKQAAVAPTNLPPPPEAFIGRIDLLAEVRKGLRAGGVIVLRGGGGFGKTTLALAVAHALHAVGEAPGGVTWLKCELAPGRDECLRQMASVFFGNRMEQEHIEGCQGQVMKHLRECQALVVFDNFETVEGDAALLRWLAAVRAPARVLLTTRQVPAGLHGQVIEVRELLRAEAAALFREKATASGLPAADRQPVELVNELCAAVGDQPLAIELLAARAALLPLPRLLERVRRDLAVLDARSDPTRPGRHQSARACLALSFEHLNKAARDLLLRLSVLPDGGGPEVITVVQGTEDWDEAAEELVAASVWRLEQNRYTVHPLVRQFALEQLGGGRAAAEHHAARAVAGLALVKAKDTHVVIAITPGVRAAFDWFAAEWSNLLAAADFALAARDWATVFQIASTVQWPWFLHGKWADAERLYRQALAASRSAANRRAEAETLENLGFVHCYMGNCVEGVEECRRSAAIFHEAEDYFREGVVRMKLARNLQLLGRWDEAETAFEQSLQLIRPFANRYLETMVFFYRGYLLLDMKRWSEAEASYQQALSPARHFDSCIIQAAILNELGVVYRHQGRWLDAERAHQQSLALWRELNDRLGTLGSQWYGRTLKNFALLRAAQGDWAAALELGRQAVATLRQSEDRRNLTEAQTLVQECEREARATAAEPS